MLAAAFRTAGRLCLVSGSVKHEGFVLNPRIISELSHLELLVLGYISVYTTDDEIVTADAERSICSIDPFCSRIF